MSHRPALDIKTLLAAVQQLVLIDVVAIWRRWANWLTETKAVQINHCSLIIWIFG